MPNGRGPARCSPASGSTFAIGDTTVLCDADDGSGNRGACSFRIHVLGAAEQLTALRDNVSSLGLLPGIDTSLVTRLEAALAAIDVSNLSDACRRLDSFIREVSGLSGKQIPPADATRLLDEARNIQRVLGCT